MFKTLEELIAIVRQRKGFSIEKSYTSKLLNNKKLSVEKVKEEITELIDAIENNLSKMPFSTRLYFQKVQTILLDELSSYNDKK